MSQICEVITAPETKESTYRSVFLAGTIDMGESFDWQSQIISEFKFFKLTFLNPRRRDWDISWKQSINDSRFNEQVNWELDKLEKSDLIFMYFAPGSKSPITLLELGLVAAKSKLLVVCPRGFWRQGNVEIVCKRLWVEFFEDFDIAKNRLKELA